MKATPFRAAPDPDKNARDVEARCSTTFRGNIRIRLKEGRESAIIDMTPDEARRLVRSLNGLLGITSEEVPE